MEGLLVEATVLVEGLVVVPEKAVAVKFNYSFQVYLCARKREKKNQIGIMFAEDCTVNEINDIIKRTKLSFIS